MTVSDGRGLESSDSGQFVAVIDATYAATAELAVGDTLEIAGEDFEVVGVVTSTSDEVDTASNVYIPLDVAQDLSGVGDAVSTVYVQATSSDAISAVQTELEEALPEATVSSQSDLASTVSGSLSSASALITNLGTWLSVIVLIGAVASFALPLGAEEDHGHDHEDATAHEHGHAHVRHPVALAGTVVAGVLASAVVVGY